MVKEHNTKYGKKQTHVFFTSKKMQKICFLSCLPPELQNMREIKKMCDNHDVKIKHYFAVSNNDFDTLYDVLSDVPESFEGLPIDFLSKYYKEKVEDFIHSKSGLEQLYPEMQFFMNFYDRVKKDDFIFSGNNNAYASLCFLHLLPIITEAINE